MATLASPPPRIVRSRVFPATPAAAALLEELGVCADDSAYQVLLAAARQGLAIDLFSYVASSPVHELLREPGKRRVLLRYPGGIMPVLAHALRSFDGDKRVGVVVAAAQPTIHAKIYRVHFPDGHELTIVGSANATRLGLRDNVETNVALAFEPDEPVSHPADPRRVFEELWQRGETWSFTEHGPQPLVDAEAYVLLPYQNDAIKELAVLERALESVDPADRSTYGTGDEVPGAIVSLPTGAGKTVTAVRWLLERVLTDTGRRRRRRVLWLAHAHDLLAQARETFRKSQSRDGDAELEFVELWESGRSAQPIHQLFWHLANRADVVFCTRQLMARRLGRGIRKEPFDVIVVDEAHHAHRAAQQYPAIFDRIPHGVRLGITATPHLRPPLQDEDLFANFTYPGSPRVGPVFSRRFAELAHVELNGKRVFAIPIRETVDTHWELDVSHVSSDDDLKRLDFADDVRVNSIVDAFDVTQHAPSLFFAVNIADANALTRALQRRCGVRAQVVHSGLPLVGDLYERDNGSLTRAERRQVIDALESAEIEAIVSVDMFIEGIDIPGLESVFLARPTSSQRVFQQMVGRGLRGPAVRGTSTVRLVVCEDRLVGRDNRHRWQPYTTLPQPGAPEQAVRDVFGEQSRTLARSELQALAGLAPEDWQAAEAALRASGELLLLSDEGRDPAYILTDESVTEAEARSVLDVVERVSAGLTKAQIAEQTGLASEAVGGVLELLVTTGVLQMDGEGRRQQYRLELPDGAELADDKAPSLRGESRRPFRIASQRELVEAFRDIEERISAGQRLLLRGHYEAHNHTCTAAELAAAADYATYNGTNLQYGRLAGMLADALGVEVAGMNLNLLVSSIHPDDNPTGQWQLVMRPEVAAALEELGWV